MVIAVSHKKTQTKSTKKKYIKTLKPKQKNKQASKNSLNLNASFLWAKDPLGYFELYLGSLYPT